MVSLLGETIVDKDGNKTNVADLDKTDVVGIYFSAHWCGPCRGFTPQLAKKYKEFKDAGKNMEMVFVSSDRDQASFDSYLGEMPWKALPYADRKRKAKLSKKFKVQGIPTLVFVNPQDGSFNDEGRSAIMSGKVNGQDCAYPFPAIPKPTFNDVAAGCTFVNKQYKESSLKDLVDAGNKYLMLYFSAHWCPPCRGFTPKLGEWYKKNVDNFKKTDKQFEMVFVSSDSDEASFKSYFGEQADWLALKYSERDAKSKLSDVFGVQGIPTLAVVDLSSGKTITTNARGNVGSDKEGKDFPWAEKPCDYLTGSNIGNVNEFAMMIAFLDDKPDCAEGALKAMIPTANKVFADADTKGDDPEMKFAVEKGESGFADRLRQTLGFEKGEESLAIFDLESRKGYFPKEKVAADAISEEAIAAFAKAYLDEDNRDDNLRTKDMKL